MSDAIEIKPAAKPLCASIRPPGSKSITNRALVCAALAEGRSTLRGALDSEDTRVMIDCLGALGVTVESRDDGRTLRVEGCAGKLPAQSAELFVANSGTTIRFLTAVAALGRGSYRLDGVERMRARPIWDLLDALQTLGADARSLDPGGCPPVLVHAAGLPGGEAALRGNVSSQYLSGLLMAAPYAERPVVLTIDGPLVSQPYVRMTLAVMQSFGVAVVASPELSRFEVPLAPYMATDYAIEPDASAASYFWAAAAIAGGEATVLGLSRSALQGDVAFCECLAQMGCDVQYGDDSVRVRGGSLQGINVDMNAISDTVQTLAGVALFADGPTTISGVGHIRHKETDRIGDLARELRKLGAEVAEHEDGLTISPGPLQAAEIDTYQDHRMAMSLALVGLKQPGVVIRDPGCVAKTYPGFFADLARVTAAQ